MLQIDYDIDDFIDYCDVKIYQKRKNINLYGWLFLIKIGEALKYKKFFFAYMNIF